MDIPERMAVARGGVLDGLAALQGAVDLLRSRRVGVKALARALPHVAEGLAAAGSAIEDLFAAITPPFAAAPSVVRHATSVLTTLRALLRDRRALDARRRIALEASLLAARRELGAVLLLGELAVQASTPETSQIELVDLLQHRLSGGRDGDAEIALSLDPDAFEGVRDVKLVVGLVEIAVSCVVAAGVVSARLEATSVEGRVELRVGAEETPSAHTILIRAYALGSDQIALALEAAHRAGVEVSFDAGGRVATITI